MSHDAKEFARRMDGPTHVAVNITAKCRKCEQCLRDRAHHWAQRAASEIRASHRTWFGTITLRPSAHYAMLSRARAAHAANFDVHPETGELVHDELEDLSEAERFRRVEAVINRELQLMVKRLRKAGHQFRFVVVCESSPDHQSGLPHYHMLLHEVGDPIKHKYLAGGEEVTKNEDGSVTVHRIPPAWPHGFTKWKLVENDKRAAWYVCKYLSKDAKVRVRASKSYGREPDTASADNVVDHSFSVKKMNDQLVSQHVTSTLPHEEGPDSPAPPRGDRGLNSSGGASDDISDCGIPHQGREGAGLSNDTHAGEQGRSGPVQTGPAGPMGREWAASYPEDDPPF